MLQTNLQHGEFDIKISGQVLVASLAGSWNEEAARAFDREFRLAAEPLLGAPWAHLVYLDDWSLGVPEMKPVIEQLVAWCCEHGLKRAAQVYSPSMLKTLQLEDLVVEQGDFQRRAFATGQQALQWLRAEGYDVAY
jgi:hypothetical protein